MFKPVWLLLIVAAPFAAGCASDPVPPQPVATPVEVAPPAEPVAAEAPSEATMPPPDEPPPPAVTKPEQVDGGKYRVSVASESSATEAAPWVKRLEAGGLRAQIEPTDVGDKTWQRVVVPGLRNGREARQMVAYIDQVLGIKGAWVIPKAAVAAAPAPMPAPAPAAPEPQVPDAEHPKN